MRLLSARDTRKSIASHRLRAYRKNTSGTSAPSAMPIAELRGQRESDDRVQPEHWSRA
jgi:hypothetical protein